MTIRACVVLVLVLLVGCAPSNPCLVNEADRVGGPDADGRFSPAALKQDWQVLQCGLETYHAGLYKFTPRAEFDRFFDDVDASLNQPMTDIEFYALVAQAVEHTHERHTRIGLWTDDDESNLLEVFDEALVFPFEIITVDGGPHLWANGSDADEPVRGDRIVAINGLAGAEIIYALFPFIVADGAIEMSKWSDAARNFRYYYYWHFDQPETFTVDYVSQATHQRGQVTVAALPLETIRKNLKERYPDEAGAAAEHPVYELEWWPGQDAAVFTLKTFNQQVYEANGIRPKDLFADVFRQLCERGVERLVLDLRDNSGGRKEILLALIPYVMRSPRAGVLRKTTSYAGREKTYDVPEPADDAFTGDLYVLVNERTWSAGAEMASFARELGNATIVGEETAGRYDGMTAGSAKYMTLPNTRLHIEIPRWRIDLSVSPQEPGRGVLPNYRSTLRIEDLVNGVDTQKQFIRDLLSAKDGSEEADG